MKYTAAITRVGTVTVEAWSHMHAFRDLRGAYGKISIKHLHKGETLEGPDLVPEVLRQLARSAQMDREAARRPARRAEQRANDLLCADYPLD